MPESYKSDIRGVRIITTKVLQQTNGSDCGVFLLYFARIFLMDPDYYYRILHENVNANAWNGETSISDTRPHICNVIQMLSDQTDKMADSRSPSLNQPTIFKLTQSITILPESARIGTVQHQVPEARAPGYILAKCPSSTSASFGACKYTKVDIPQMMDVDMMDSSMMVGVFI
ncbi:hypothetical protein BC938DRAFT_483064 [Jimgerdemannia flammicorona]|uniref:Ubiquitin-like protease family profile domain-containing protein n=1 Tax=Jimgerdemannia flammicorona TaxID=994334 RepID=A0A433QCS6_9FUNG|nr:hypothetical protein BC938DRAFT_483064 [Jimgerdemannia flammicorona]